MAYKLITAPATEPIDLTTAKLHLRVDSSADDALITAMIIAARESAEKMIDRALITQTWEVVLDSFQDAFELRRSPIQSVTSVKYLDSANVEQTLDPADYIADLDSEPGYVVIGYGKAWPATFLVPNAVRCRYVAGYGNAAAVPQSIKAWMLLAIGTLYMQRETFVQSQATAIPNNFWSSLIDPYRMY